MEASNACLPDRTNAASSCKMFALLLEDAVLSVVLVEELVFDEVVVLVVEIAADEVLLPVELVVDEIGILVVDRLANPERGTTLRFQNEVQKAREFATFWYKKRVK